MALRVNNIGIFTMTPLFCHFRRSSIAGTPRGTTTTWSPRSRTSSLDCLSLAAASGRRLHVWNFCREILAGHRLFVVWGFNSDFNANFSSVKGCFVHYVEPL